MIQALRRVHRRAFWVLAVVLPLILLAGLGARRARVPSTLLAARLPDTARLVRKSNALWHRHAVQTVFYADSNRPGQIFLVLHPAQAWNEPDLLLYWSADPPQGNTVPAHAQLLDAFAAGKVFELPPNAATGGHLLLFSLPHQSVFDAARVEKLP